jgi:SAM-dependent methyltransferase
VTYSEAFAKRYDEWSAHMSEDIPFYVGLARDADGPLLELAVGDGRVAIPVARATGRPVVGIDSSRTMLDRARRRAAEAGVVLDLREADMRDLEAELARVHANDGKEGLDPARLSAQTAERSELGDLLAGLETPTAAVERRTDHFTDPLKFGDSILDLAELRASKSMPGAFPIEEPGDLVQAETGPLAEQDRLHPPDRSGRVAALPSGAVGRSNEPDPVVVAERRRGDARPGSQFSDRQPLAHGDLLT